MIVFTINAVPSIIPEAPTATMEYVCFNVACTSAKEPGVEAVVILPITPRSEEAPAKSRHHVPSRREQFKVSRSTKQINFPWGMVIQCVS